MVKLVNRHFSREEKKTSSIGLIIKAMKITMRYQPVRMVVMKKQKTKMKQDADTYSNTCWPDAGETGVFYTFGGNVKHCSNYRKQLKNSKYIDHVIQQCHIWPNFQNN